MGDRTLAAVGGGAALTAEGRAVRLAAGDGGAGGAAWTLTELPDGRHRVAPAGGAGGPLCLTGGEAPGDGVSLLPPDASWLSQRWRVEPVFPEAAAGDDRRRIVRLRCEWTGLPLTRDGAGGVRMGERPADGPAARWRLEPPRPTTSPAD